MNELIEKYKKQMLIFNGLFIDIIEKIKVMWRITLNYIIIYQNH